MTTTKSTTDLKSTNTSQEMQANQHAAKIAQLDLPTAQDQNDSSNLGSFRESQFWDELMNPEVRNYDNEGLGSVSAGPFTIGYVDEVNGFTAQEVPAFAPTMHELLILVSYWAEIAIESEHFFFAYQSVGSTDRRRRNFAWRRVDRIRGLLGEKAVDEAVQRVVGALGKRHQESRCWQVFLYGTDEERNAMQEEIAQEMSRAAFAPTSESVPEVQS